MKRPSYAAPKIQGPTKPPELKSFPGMKPKSVRLDSPSGAPSTKPAPKMKPKSVPLQTPSPATPVGRPG